MGTGENMGKGEGAHLSPLPHFPTSPFPARNAYSDYDLQQRNG